MKLNEIIIFFYDEENKKKHDVVMSVPTTNCDPFNCIPQLNLALPNKGETVYFPNGDGPYKVNDVIRTFETNSLIIQVNIRRG